jgi:hypothetical protein
MEAGPFVIMVLAASRGTDVGVRTQRAVLCRGRLLLVKLVCNPSLYLCYNLVADTACKTCAVIAHCMSN